MSEPTRKTFAEELVAQDPPLSEEQRREHRGQLEKALTDASRREFRVRMIILVLWLLCVIVPIIDRMPAVGLANGGRVRFLRAYPPEVCVLLIVTIVETVSYFVRFLPARLRAGSALNRDILQNLDCRITVLSDRIDQAAKRKPAGAVAMTSIFPPTCQRSLCFHNVSFAGLLFLILFSTPSGGKGRRERAEAPQIEKCRARLGGLF